MPLSAYAVPERPEQFDKIENELSLACSEYGEESCSARFLAMSACTYIFAINKGKHPDEALAIADELFVRIMRGNKIKPQIMFNNTGTIKKEIGDEANERIGFCKEATEKAIPKLFLARRGEEPSPELVKGLTRTYGKWWLKTIETIYMKGGE